MGVRKRPVAAKWQPEEASVKSLTVGETTRVATESRSRKRRWRRFRSSLLHFTRPQAVRPPTPERDWGRVPHLDSEKFRSHPAVLYMLAKAEFLETQGTRWEENERSVRKEAKYRPAVVRGVGMKRRGAPCLTLPERRQQDVAVVLGVMDVVPRVESGGEV
jgi:hypothetical protein